MFLDRCIKSDCWNLYDSYGVICVGCGCCSQDKATRYRARLDTARRWLAEKEDFDCWCWDDDPEMRAIQERNHRSSIRHLRWLIRYYKKKVRELDDVQNNDSGQASGA